MLLAAAPAFAVLDIDDRGPVLDAGGFSMRITNAGIIGNAFFNQGVSNDPSFEFPAHSGRECLNHAELWVGGTDPLGTRRVSGGPVLEWRPTLDEQDRVLLATRARLGTQRLVDDDGDGLVDEEILNGIDDDGDGEVDEDLGLSSYQIAAADYVDDRPEAVGYLEPNGESHVPMHLSVHQEAFAWAVTGYRSIAGLRFTITNHGTDVLRDVYVGLLADLDSRLIRDVTGHLNDRIELNSYSRTFNDGSSLITNNGVGFCDRPPCPPTPCFKTLQQTVPMLRDGIPNSGLPVVAVIGLDHTTDPLALMAPARGFARAPGRVSFRYSVFSNSHAPGQGGVPVQDGERYLALAGQGEQANIEQPDDYQVLVSCGPFASLGPGQSLSFDAALIAGENPDSLKLAIENTLAMQRGAFLNLLPDSGGTGNTQYDVGATGLTGHEACVEAPPGVSFQFQADCFQPVEETGEPPPLTLYRHGQCVWTNADCDICTGIHGNETVMRWTDPGEVPPSPGWQVIPGDHRITIRWDNLPEVLIRGGVAGVPTGTFLGYRLYRLADWRRRESLLPPAENWALLGAYSGETQNGEIPLASVIDTTVDYDRVLYEQKLYPPGRYFVVDSLVQNGFDYVYVVTSVHRILFKRVDGSFGQRTLESPLVATFDQRVTPHESSTNRAGTVWVVPNPFRANASWDRPPVSGDALTRHIDFMGLPRALSTIRIFTVAGDFVAQIVHDGRTGDGEAAWDLISRNGQDVVSGIYIFTVTSDLGHQTGRFVVIR
jgi:hypothetical protein